MRKFSIRFLAVSLFLVIGIFCLEIVLIGVDWIRDGELISPLEKVRMKLNTNQVDGNVLISGNGEECRWLDMFRSHPYVMYAKRASGDCSDHNINRQGFVGPDYPVEKLDKTFTILVTGGSVAESLMVGDRVTPLETILNREYRMDGFAGFRVIVGAMAASRQPSAMILMALYSRILHGYISLDGFNEFELINSPGSRMAGHPADPFVMQGISNTLDVGKYLFARCDELLLRTQLKSTMAMKLRGFYYVTQAFRDLCRVSAARMAARSFDDSQYMSYFTFPAEVRDLEFQRRFNSAQFLQYIRTTSAIAKANGIKELHIVQPVPAFKKVLHEEERRRVQDLSYGPLYKKMAQEWMALNAEGVPVVNMAGLFDDTQAAVFVDRIHLSNEGKEVLLAKIVETLVAQWGLKRK